MGESGYPDSIPHRGAIRGKLYASANQDPSIFHLDVHLHNARYVTVLHKAVPFLELNLTGQ